MYKKLILCFITCFTFHRVHSQNLITLSKDISHLSDLSRMSFSGNQFSGKTLFIDMELYNNGRLVVTGSSNNFISGDKSPGDIFFTSLHAIDSSYKPVVNYDDALPQGDYEAKYKITSVKPRDVLATQSIKFSIRKGKPAKAPQAKNDKTNIKTGIKTDTIVEVVTAGNSGGLRLSGYVDAYYGYYTDSVAMAAYQRFPSVSPRSRHIGLNTAVISAQYDGEKTRSIVALQFGDMPRSAWSNTFNPVMEAHAGYRLNSKLWLDAGFFRTHFGTEGFLPRENLVSSLAVNTYYEPLYEAGVRLQYNPNDKLTVYGYLLNGYNLYEDNNHKKSLGFLVSYALGDKGNINYSNYLGDDSSLGDTVSHFRFHQNAYLNYGINKWKLQIGVDFGIQKNSHLTLSGKTATMFGGLATVRYQATNKFAVTGRGEVFNDPEGFMSGVMVDKTGLYTGFKMWGLTLSLEYKPEENIWIRLEGREMVMQKDQQIFRWNGMDSNKRMEVTMDIGFSF